MFIGYCKESFYITSNTLMSSGLTLCVKVDNFNILPEKDSNITFQNDLNAYGSHSING